MRRVVRIWGADIYRDGGSYGFWFDSDDGNWYEFFLQATALDRSAVGSHHPPVIYLGGLGNKRVVQRLSWDEANAFVAHLQFESGRFRELLDIVKIQGKGIPVMNNLAQ